MVTKRTERTGTGEVERRRGIRGVRRRQRSGETEDGFILCFEGLFNVPVQFAIGSSSLRYVEIASSSYIAVRGIEGEGTCDVLKLGKRDVLYKQCVSATGKHIYSMRNVRTFIVESCGQCRRC